MTCGSVRSSGRMCTSCPLLTHWALRARLDTRRTRESTVCTKEDPTGHALIWTWIKGKHVLACVVQGCGHVVKEPGRTEEPVEKERQGCSMVGVCGCTAVR